MNYPINNISFELEYTHQEFSFTKSYNSNEWGCACLQLPETGDSQNLIEDAEEVNWGDEEREIFKQLQDFYFDSFKDVECAAAAALLAKNIIHVEKVDELYVAFTEAESFVIKESRVRDYFNKRALFDFLDDFEDLEDVDLTEIQDKGKKAFFKDLDRDLTVLMQEDLDAVDAINIDDAWIEGAFDEVLHKFMKDNFGNDDYSGAFDEEVNEISFEYYQNHGCDTRADFEREAREKMGKGSNH